MLLEESLWFKDRLHYIEQDDAYSVLNIGSSTKTFRSKIQSHIDKNIFNILEKRGINVFHVDQKDDEGIDIIGDFDDNELIDRLKETNCKAIFCNNLLMHLKEYVRPKVVSMIKELLPQDGLLYLSTSYRFPYTPDPYDSFYRPDLKELLATFSDFVLLESEVIYGNYSLYKTSTKNPKMGLVILIRLFTPFYKFRTWKYLIKYLPNFFKKYSTICLILKKK